MGYKYAIHKLNGKIVNIATKSSVSEGIIGFQPETADIYYRNMQMKELTECVPIEQFMGEHISGCSQ